MSIGKGSGFAAVFRGPLLVLSFIALVMAFGAAPPNIAAAEDPDKLGKNIERMIGGAKRRVVSDPPRASREVAQIRDMLGELRAADANHPMLPRLQREYQKLATQVATKMYTRIEKDLAGKRRNVEGSLKINKRDQARAYRDQLADALKTHSAVLENAGDKGAELKADTEAFLAQTAAALGGSGTVIAAAASDAAAADVDKLLKAIKRHIPTDAKRADAEYGEALQKLETLRAANHPGTGDFETRLADLKRKIDKRLGRTGAGGPAGPATTGTVATGETTAEGELPSAVRSRLNVLTSTLDAVEGRLDNRSMPAARRLSQATRSMGRADELYQAIMKYRDQIPPDHPGAAPLLARYEAVAKRMEALRAQVAQEKAAADAESDRQRALDEAWGRKIRAYTATSSPKYFCACATNDAAELKAQQALYEELSAVIAEYDKVAFTEKSDWLLQIERDARNRLKNWQAESEQSIARVVEQAAMKLRQEVSFLEGKQDWKSDPGKRPYVLADDRIANAERLIAKAATFVAAEDPRMTALNSEMKKLVALNKERRTERTKRTFMSPDRFQGGGIDAIKEAAARLVAEKQPGVEVLRVTVPSADWKEETVEEWTDTTKTAIRRRTTRSVSAQLAGRTPDGVFLWYLNVAKDRRSDATWSALYGNIMFTDRGEPMLEENVGKDGPH